MRRFPTLVVLASLLVVGAAAADSSNDPHVESGLRLRREHRDAEALEEFRRAHDAHPSPRTRAQIGFAEQALGQWAQAETDLGAALESREDPWIASHIDSLQAALTAIRQHLGSLIVEANLSGAELWMQGTRFGTLPISTAHLPVGEIEIEVRAQGYESVHRTVDVPAGGTVTARFEFAAAGTPLPSREPPRPALTEPPPDRSSPSGPATRRSLAWGTLGAAGAFLGAGIAAQVVRQVNANRYNDDTRCLFGGLSRDERCGAYRGRAESAQTLAYVAYVSAGALAVASVVLFLESPRPSKTGRITWLVGAQASGLEVGCTGQF